MLWGIPHIWINDYYKLVRQQLLFITDTPRNHLVKENWVFATNSNFLIPKSKEPNFVAIWYFKLWILLSKIIKVWNIKGVDHKVTKI